MRSASSEAIGPGSEYLLEVETVEDRRRQILIGAVDRLNPETAPFGAVAIVDGVERYAFDGSTILNLTGMLGEGEHTLEVRAEGYRPMEHPSLPDQVANPLDSTYGNPRKMIVDPDRSNTSVFLFWPTIQVKAEVMDFITGEPLDDVAIRFLATSGPLGNLFYDGYPEGSTYQSSWRTTKGGLFPEDLLLPTADWDLTLTRAGYFDANFSNSIAAPAAGDLVDLERLFLVSEQFVLKPDVFEPDDNFEQATPIGLKVPQRHNIDRPDDQDWVRLGVVTNFSYRFKTVQQGRGVDTVLDLFVEELDGTLTPVVENWNENGRGFNVGEELVLHDLPSGIYYLRITDHEGNNRSRDPEILELVHSETGGNVDSTAYDVVVETPGGPATIVLLGAINRLVPTDPPTGGVVVIDDVMSYAFTNGITVDVTGQLSSGIHTVRVEAAGFVPVEDPSAAGQVQNLDNELYGNPRRIAVADGKLTAPFFMMWPMAEVEAVVQDAWTGEPVEGAAIEATGISGVLTNVVYDGYPAFTTHEVDWFTEAGGSFPSLRLPTVDWDLRISKQGYTDTLLPGAVQNAQPGDRVDLGVIPLSFTNHPPEVDVGEQQVVGHSASASLSATVSDDGFPAVPGSTTTLWSSMAGPGSVVFADAGARMTSATFSLPGLYTLRLTASRRRSRVFR